MRRLVGTLLGAGGLLVLVSCGDTSIGVDAKRPAETATRVFLGQEEAPAGEASQEGTAACPGDLGRRQALTASGRSALKGIGAGRRRWGLGGRGGHRRRLRGSPELAQLGLHKVWLVTRGICGIMRK